MLDYFYASGGNFIDTYAQLRKLAFKQAKTSQSE